MGTGELVYAFVQSHDSVDLYNISDWAEPWNRNAEKPTLQSALVILLDFLQVFKGLLSCAHSSYILRFEADIHD